MMSLKRAASYAYRELLTRGPVAYVAENRHRRRLRRHAPSLPAIGPVGEKLVQAVNHQGFAAASLDELDLDSTPRLLAALDAILAQWRPERARGATRQSSALRPDGALVDAQPGLFLWGLDTRLLGVVEGALGLSPLYLGPELKCEPADGGSGDVRQWHMDVEDRRVIKILIYLNDVPPGHGALEYIPKEASRSAAAALRYRSGFVPDAAIAAHVPPGRWMSATGPRHSVAIFDGAQVFHRAGVPTRGDRYSLTYTYTSRKPFRLWGGGASDRLIAKIDPLLSPHQRSCIHR